MTAALLCGREEGSVRCENIIYEFTSLRSSLIPSHMFSITLQEVLHRGGLPYRRKADYFDPKFTFPLLFLRGFDPKSVREASF